MRKQLLVAAIAAAIATTGWAAEKNRAPKHEAIGLGTGAVIGAAAAGPVGFVLGGAFGGWVGDRFERERAQRMEAEERYAALRTEADTLEALLARNEQELGRLVAQLETERMRRTRMLEEALELEVYFRTAKSELDPGAAERLARIAELIGAMDGAVVMLEGHADSRGDAAYNEALSAARAEHVRQIFIDAGVPAERIAVTAEGENQAVAEPNDVDGLALERRVSISIMGPDSGPRVARKD